MKTSELMTRTAQAIDQNLQMLSSHLDNLVGRLDAASDLLYLCELDEEEMKRANADLTTCRDALYTLMSEVSITSTTIQITQDMWE